jgi:hypothetical protein
MYKSSSITFIYRYILPLLFGTIFLYLIITTWKREEAFIFEWYGGTVLLFCWAMIWLIVMMLRLKTAEANKDHIVVDTLRGKKEINYDDIEWISQIALIQPALISIKYFDRDIGDYKKILLMPGKGSPLYSFNIFKESAMTKFIRRRTMLNNPYYSKENEPSCWLPVLYIFLTGLPIILISNFLYPV